MIRIQLVSDLHLDARPFTLKPNPVADLIVLAGDFGPIRYNEARVARVLANLDGRPAIVVLGNHDYYGSTFIQTIADWHELLERFPNVQLLDDSDVTFQGIRFVGGTLWSDFCLYCPDMSQADAMRNALLGITDFRTIRRTDGTLIMPADLIPRHDFCCDVIGRVVAEGLPTVVVTHFLPSEQAIHPMWKQRGRPCNPYFASSCEHLLRDNVLAWYFGHTHTAADFVIGSTKFRCNPRGYDSKENPLWNDQLIVEV